MWTLSVHVLVGSVDPLPSSDLPPLLWLVACFRLSPHCHCPFSCHSLQIEAAVKARRRRRSAAIPARPAPPPRLPGSRRLVQCQREERWPERGTSPPWGTPPAPRAAWCAWGGRVTGSSWLLTWGRSETTSRDLKILPCAVNNPPVRVLALAFL